MEKLIIGVIALVVLGMAGVVAWAVIEIVLHFVVHSHA